jgi:hypothetical protein
VIRGSLTQTKAPVAIAGHYARIPLAGPVREFDARLDFWLTRSVTMGMIGADLGELFPIHFRPEKKKQLHVVPDTLLLVGMGEPGRFGRDDLRFLACNVTVAVKVMGHDEFSTTLIGTRRSELSIESALRGLLEGVVDAYERLSAMLSGVRDLRSRLEHASASALIVTLVEPDEHKIKEIIETLRGLAKDKAIRGLEDLEVRRGKDVGGPRDSAHVSVDLPPVERVTLMTTTRVTRSDGQGPDIFRYSALGESAAISVREVEVNSYFARQFPSRLADCTSASEQDELGRFFTNMLIPDDFRQLVENSDHLTLVVDEKTASFPWEMAQLKGRQGSLCFGTDLRLSRQFQTLLSAVPGIPPPLNRTLDVLIIADPGSDELALPGARAEGLAVAGVLRRAWRVWKGIYDVRTTVRIGRCADRESLSCLHEQLRPGEEGIQTVGTCDPFELVQLLLKNTYDVVHYAGHGIFDPDKGRMGWLLDKECVLSASEVFRIRQVPRLVFANACHSAVTAERAPQQRQQVGLAQAFFARGIQNYVGSGWAVDDALARDFAVRFYEQLLGLREMAEDRKPEVTAPPATLGDSLKTAREAIRGRNSSTWGAYQHYGCASDKLLPVPNRDDDE